MKKKGLLVIIAGPSGVGKGTIRRELAKDKKIKLYFSISLTTRKRRKGEKNGVDYFYVSEEKFKKAIQNNELIEYTKFVDNYYGTSKTQVDALRNEGKDVLLEIEINGVLNVIKQFEKTEIISFFIVPPSLKELENRIRGRSTESDEVIKNRLKRAKEELKYKKYFNHVIVNDDYKRATKEISSILKNEIKIRSK